MSRTGQFNAKGCLTLGDLKRLYCNASQLGYSDEATVEVVTYGKDADDPEAAVVVTVLDLHLDPADDLSAVSDSSGPETTTTARR